MRACVCLTRQFCILIHRQNCPSVRLWRSSGSSQTGPGVNRRAEFLVPSLWAKLLEEIRLGHSSAERRPGIADVKNGVTGRVRSGLFVTELDNFCSIEHPLREVISSHFSKSFSSSVMSVCMSVYLTGRARRPRKKTWEILGYGFQDLGSQLWGLGNFRIWFSGLGISTLGPGFSHSRFPRPKPENF